MNRRRSVTAALVLVVGGVTLTPAAHAGTSGPEAVELSSAELDASVRRWQPDVSPWDVAASVESIETVETENGETTISLATDILFTPNSWELPANAAGRLEELVADVPDGAQVSVRGHTDSTPTGQDFDNLELSQHRAEAVADVLRRVRPDLQLDVAGLGSTEPAVPEDPDDPSTFAENRRVEIVYAG